MNKKIRFHPSSLILELLWCGVTVAYLVVTQWVRVRFLPPQLRKGKPIGDGTRLERGRGESPCRFNSCPFRSKERMKDEG